MKLIRFISVLFFLFFSPLFVLVLPVAKAKAETLELRRGSDPPFVCKQIKDPNLSKKRNGFSATSLLSPAKEYEDATGEQNILVVFVTGADQDTSKGTSELEEKAKEALFDGEESANKYLQEISQGKMSLKGDILSGWVILPKNSDEYGYGQGSSSIDHEGILRDAISAIDPDVYFPNYSRIIIFLRGEKWGYSMGSVGKWGEIESDDGLLSLGICWISENSIDNKYTLWHEILHTFGTIHSGAIYLKKGDSCDRLCSFQEITKADDSTWPPLDCSTDEYGDGLCLLGHGHGHPSAFVKYKLGWLNEDQVLVVTESAIAKLIPRASSLDGIKMIIIKAKDADGTTKTYFLELFKRLDNFDSSNKNGSKVLIRFFNEEENLNDSGTILLFKKNETEEDKYYDILNLKEEPFCDKENGIEIQFTSESGEEMVEENSYAELEITLSCPEEKAPVVSVSPDYTQTMAGENVISEISISNEMATGCGTRTINVEATLPNVDWSATFSPSSTLELGPGGAGTVTAAVWIPESAPVGSYNATFKVTDQGSGLSGETTMTIEVLRPVTPFPTPTTTPTPEKMTLFVSINGVDATKNDNIVVTRGSRVAIKVRAEIFDGTFVEDLKLDKILCEIKNPRGKVKLSEEQENTYEGVFRYKIKKKAPLGWYEIKGSVSKKGYQTASFQGKFKAR
ncbi:MAG: Peptidase M11 gametolysin [Parcubacteria group bacterium GW2011_GWB1_43_8]|nr:MAG: Peptidase M11 gametolysin [Parcubacteria group bacterium GW2011_GWB1_43_8]